ncbi:MAG: hypothetical protein H6701_03075 [Myxococcales bacterium]|nr:hypothetical protein [Myxococcales bacterium]
MAAQRLTDEEKSRFLREVLVPAAPPGTEPFVATPADAEGLSALSRALFGDEGFGPAQIRRTLRHGHGILFGLAAGEEVLSYTLLELNMRQARIYTVESGTVPAARGRGLHLWHRAQMEALGRRLGYRTLTSHVRPGNAAMLRLMARTGMEVVARLPGYYDDGGEGLYLRKRLTG